MIWKVLDVTRSWQRSSSERLRGMVGKVNTPGPCTDSVQAGAIKEEEAVQGKTSETGHGTVSRPFNSPSK